MIFSSSPENVYCEYLFEVRDWGTSNEYPQQMF